MTALLNGHAVNVASASTSVTAIRGSVWRNARAHVAPAKPPPTTTTRGPAPWATAGSGMSAVDAATPSFRNCRRLVFMADAYRCARSFLGGEPGGDGLDLVVGESLRDAIHDGARALPRTEVLHPLHDRRAVHSGQARHR